MNPRRHPSHVRPLVFLCALLSLACTSVRGAESHYAGRYLYANPPEMETFKGSLTITFAEPGDKLVVAYGRRNRKDRKSREETTEQSREIFKPYMAELKENGRVAVFPHLPPDFYDIVVVITRTMTLYEGLELLRDSVPEKCTEAFVEEASKSLSRTEDRIGGWEGFFDTKQFNRFETDGGRGSMLVQQMRLGKAYAESGDVLKGCIHSIDICWLERAKVEGVGWQVVTRQQLYRDEIASREFFTHVFVPELKGVRVGFRAKELGPIALPAPK